MRILFVGDIVGRAGREVARREIPKLREAWRLDLVVVNGENAAGGYGITEALVGDLLGAGADVITLGNHAFDQREVMIHIAREPRLIRPANFMSGTPGAGSAVVEARNGGRVLVVNLIGRTFMGLADDPFAVIERELCACPLGRGADAIVVDMHAEASSEKMAMGYFCDGRASLVVGTHTHVPTADTRILPAGTAYQTDAGMTGDYESIIGFERHEPMRRFLRSTPGTRFEPAEGPGTLCGLALETDDGTGLAVKVAPVRLGGGVLGEARPGFW